MSAANLSTALGRAAYSVRVPVAQRDWKKSPLMRELLILSGGRGPAPEMRRPVHLRLAAVNHAHAEILLVPFNTWSAEDSCATLYQI